MNVRMTKIQGNHIIYRDNQKVWLRRMTGNQAAEVVGRYRGRGRYVVGWLRWTGPEDVPKWVTCDVDDDFAARNRLEELNR